MCVLGYAGFFCFNELAQLRRCDFQFEDSFMRILIQRRTDIYIDGAWAVIAKTFKPTCPVLLTLRYFAVASFSEDGEGFIFRPLSVVVMDLTDSAVLFHCPILGRARWCIALLRPLTFPGEITVFIA